jgi:hypothetical protein
MLWTIKFNSIRLRGINNIIVCHFLGNDILIPDSIVKNIVGGMLCIMCSSFKKLPEFDGMIYRNCCYD